jgi:hypothetical protein
MFEIYEDRIEIKLTGLVDIKDKRISELKLFFSQRYLGILTSVEKYNNILAIVIQAKLTEEEIIDIKDDIM